MPFLHPAMAWTAIGLASIPIIIHLLNRRRLRRIDWAAMEFLLAALKKNKRRVRIEQLILLLCRILLMLLIAFFLARPLLESSGWLAGALQTEEKIFVLDDSLTMSQRQADRTLFQRGTSALSSALARVAANSPRDPLTILRTSRPEAPIVRGSTINRERAAEIETGLGDLQTTATRAKLDKAFDLLADHAAATAAEKAAIPRVVSVLTDLRASDWTDGSGGANADLKAALERISENGDFETRIVVLDVGSQDVRNVSVEKIEIIGGRPTVGLRTQVQLTIRNWGSADVNDIRLQLRYAPVEQDPSAASMTLASPIARIGPGDSAIASIQCTFRTPGEYWATAEITGAGDSIQGDNQLSCVLDVVEATEVLLVNGEPSSERFEGETDFLAAALRPTGEMTSGLSPQIVVEDNLPRGDFSHYGAIFLANVYRMPPDFLKRLGEYVRQGGMAVIFLGDQFDQVIYDRDLGTASGAADEEHPARGLLPAAIGELQVVDDAPVALLPAIEHRYFEFLGDGGEKYLRDISFFRYFKLAPTPTAQVLATFDDGADSPAILEHGVDAGRVILFASTADSEWHDWTRNATFPVLLQEIMRKAGHYRALHTSHVAGSVTEIPLDITTHDAKGTKLRNPDYPKSPERDLIASPQPDDPTNFRLKIDDTFTAGVSFLKLSKRDGTTEARALAIRSEPEESNLQRITQDQLRQLYPDINLSVVRDVESFADTGRGQFEISDILIALFVLLLLIEGVLAWWFAHHRSADDKGILEGGLGGSGMKRA